MAQIAAFPGIRYDYTATNGDLSTLIAPPYDVLDQADKDALLAKSPHNIVAVDLPHLPPKSAGPIEVYEKAAQTLQAWLSAGRLVREDQPALYLYHQTFEYAGKQYTRKKFFARIKLQPFSDGVVLPHERTFGGPKEDRLALMKTTQCNVSPVFGLYTDPEDRVGQAFAPVAETKPPVTAELEGVRNEMWIVTDPAVVDAVVTALADKKIYIADGHHRYGTALNYRDWLAEQQGGQLPADHPAQFALMVLGSMDDPGSLIIPYNRTLANVDVDTVVDAWGPGVAPVADAAMADICLFDGRSGREVLLAFTNRPVLRELQAGEVEPWYDLDAAYLHRYLIDELLAKKLGSAPDVRYTKSAENTREVARETQDVGLLMRATPMEHLRAVSEAGGLMPQKSTFFYPKLATGMVLNPLA